VLGIRFLSEAYIKADPGYTGRATVPAAVDSTTGRVVNNDYFKLTNYWETVGRLFINRERRICTPLRYGFLNETLFHEVNNAVYKAVFAQSQSEY
jgi:putative glutathione S-transferase